MFYPFAGAWGRLGRGNDNCVYTTSTARPCLTMLHREKVRMRMSVSCLLPMTVRVSVNV